MELISLTSQKNESTTSAQQKVIAYLENHDLASMEKGSHAIKGDDFFVNVIEYDTTDEENRIWEAHKAYLDIHVVATGKERIYHSFIENMTSGEYHEDDDYLEITGSKESVINVSPNQLLVFYPEDTHKTGVKAGQAMTVKKGVFKIKI
ncbi:YhcH/YjgK/YiaL family protein [Tetragenococcus koreensis]|uniref:YhcH/YjgK/YiaL family protein n=1 Tax=Tetragenococcus koreensis TaxID=290335 RepID=UPI001F385273|nr:YhcH/YjgK/YiaL family protein [Tetragenococcus koreensis]MCF1620487.1 YhcH/YjgK/YiaL family protein [Tetragenococcus koreensis]MCF1657981.1 YhcH/YjgK/YiaL family protein [Tetragenococcus koreensis]